MEKDNYHSKTNTIELVFEYEAMSHEGTVGFLEKTDFLRIIEYYRNEEELEKAIEVLRPAISQYPFSYDLHLLHSELLLEMGKPDLALEAISQAEASSPNELEIHLLKAEIWASKNDKEKAFSILDDVTSKEYSKEEKSELAFCKACIHEHFKEFNKMFDSLRNAVLIYPENKPALERLWLGVELSRRYKDSIWLHNRLIEDNPYCYISWYNLGHAHSCLGQHENAAKSFEYAYLINETFEYAYRDCAESWIRIRAFEKAIRCLDEIAEHFDVDTNILLKKGFCYEELADYKTAKSLYLQALENDETNGEIYFRLGNCYAKESNWNEAVQAFEKATLIDNRSEEYFIALANAHSQNAALIKALKCYQQVVEIAPEQSSHWVDLAKCLMLLGQYDEAIIILKEAKIYAPSPQLLFCKVACLFQMKKRSEAIKLFSEGLEIDYNQHFVLFDWLPSLKKDQGLLKLLQSS